MGCATTPKRFFIGLLAAAVCSRALCAQTDLFADRVYPTVTAARVITSLRLDGDALPDLVVGESNGLTRMLSAGGGTLQVLPKISSGNVMSLLVADMRADGSDDIVFVDSVTGMVKVLFSDGTGNLMQSASVSSGGGAPEGLASGDFNGDGRLDIVVANQGSDNVGVLFGDGFGGLASAVAVPVGKLDGQSASMPRGVATGDVNEDGKLDIVTANNGYPSTLSILLGDGAGHFGAPTLLQMGAIGFWGGAKAFLVDTNHDGHLDIVSNGSVRLGDGTGAYAAPLPPFGYSHVLDFDGDGNVDDVSGSGLLRITLGNGLGGTLATDTFVSGSNAVDVAVADFDLDGDLDAAVLNRESAGSPAFSDVHILLNDGSAGFAPPTYETLPTGNATSQRLAIADLDDDGDADLVALSQTSSTLAVLLGDGAGDFLPPTLVTFGMNSTRDFALADIDGDGDEDAAVLLGFGTTLSDVVVLLGDGAGDFAALPSLPVGKQILSLALGDVDEDGIADLVTTGADPDVFQVRLGTGTGTFAPPSPLPLFFPCCNGWVVRTQLIDMNVDGHLDALMARYTGAFAVALGDGHGAFGAPLLYGGLGETLVAADLDADGDLDIVGRDGSRTIGVMLAIPGGYAPAVVFDSFRGVPAVGDLDADGDPDIVALDNSTSDTTCLLNDGAGHFAVHGTFLAGGRPVEGFVEDLDGNGYGAVVALCTDSASQLGIPDHVTVMRGQSASPWLGVGHSLAGTQGAPSLTGFGTLQPGSTITLKIAHALSSGSAVLAIGAVQIDAPFKGGVFVPQPAILIFGLPLGPAGGFAASGTWYAGLPSGISVYFQAWIADPAGPAGFAATNGLRGTTP